MSARDHQKIEWVVFDLGAVLIDWSPRYAFQKMHQTLGLAPTVVEERTNFFLREIATSAWNAQMDAGTPFQTAIDQRAAEFPEWKEWLQMWRDEWPTMMRDLVPDVLEVFNEVVRRRDDRHIKGIFALSNWEAGTFKIARARFPFLDKFDGRLISGEERLIKPDPNFFKLLESRFGVNPMSAIFIDDLAKNTQVAEGLGYQVHLFETAAALRVDLQSRGILDSSNS